MDVNQFCSADSLELVTIQFGIEEAERNIERVSAEIERLVAQRESHQAQHRALMGRRSVVQATLNDNQ